MKGCPICFYISKTIAVKFNCVLILSIVFMLSVGCQPRQVSKESSGLTVAEVAETSGKCKISINPKLELLEVVQYLADDPKIRKNGYDEGTQKYAEDIKNYFQDFKEEPVVNLYKQMNAKGFTYGRIPELSIRLDECLNLVDSFPNLDNYIKNTQNDKNTLIEFLQQLSDLRMKSKYDDFYKSHEGYYGKLVSDVKSKMEKMQLIDRLTAYYGYEQNSYNLVLYPMSIGGYAERFKAANGKYDIYDYMCTGNKDSAFSSLLLHEFGHSYVNPLGDDKYSKEVNCYSKLYEPIRESMTKNGYPTWGNCVNDHMTNAVACRIMSKTFSAADIQKIIGDKKNMGFIYLEALCHKLEQYENNRNTYPTLDDFYPELLKVFAEAS